MTRCRSVAALALTLLAAIPGGAAARSRTVRDGPVRLQVLTPTLIRMEYAADGRFEDGPTMTAVRTALPAVRVRTRIVRGWLTITTDQLVLRYRRGSGPFTPSNVQLTLMHSGRRVTVAPAIGSSPGNLGGWTRALDLQSGPVPLHDGVLSRDGDYVLDDTRTVLLTRAAPGFTVRPAHAGSYQDLYLFGYGDDYARGLSDLRVLTGPAPLLPRSAFGVWFSGYYPYSESDYHALLAQFRAHAVPLDTLSIDTDFKRVNDPVGGAIAATIAGAPGRPYSWNGWEWDTGLFGDPVRFTSWAHAEGLSLAVNIHPSIDTRDPAAAMTVARSGPLATDSGCKLLQADVLGACTVFDWTNPAQLSAYFALHEPFAASGVDFFWLDWCCDGSSANAPGLSADTWINSRYAAFERARGLRWPAFSRIGASFGPVADGDRGAGDGGAGAFAEHRYAIQFTGDTCATSQMLAFEARLSAAEAALGLPYVSDDIGSFNGVPVAGQCSAQTGLLGEHLPDDLYARWVAFGTFQPLDRLHSNHGDRLPWTYGSAANAAASAFLRLREALVPYTYTLARRAYDTGLPITGPLYLQWPHEPGSYAHPPEYTFGSDVVVAPVTAPGDPAPASFWVPPGTWIDWFTGHSYAGPSVQTARVPLTQMPVLIRAGAIIPTQPARDFTAPAPPAALILTVFAGRRSRFTLYDDAGTGFGYTRGASARTTITSNGSGTVAIGAAHGRFAGAPRARSWEVRLLDVDRPATVRVDGHAIAAGGAGARAWSYDPVGRTLTIDTGQLPTTRRAVISTQV